MEVSRDKIYVPFISYSDKIKMKRNEKILSSFGSLHLIKS